RSPAQPPGRARGTPKAAIFLGPAGFAPFPRWSRYRPAEVFARQQALFRATGAPPSDADVRAAYQTAMAQFRQQCPSGRFVSHILVPSQQLAAGLAAQIRAGASFEQIASQQSTDATSARDGG